MDTLQEYKRALQHDMIQLTPTNNKVGDPFWPWSARACSHKANCQFVYHCKTFPTVHVQ